MIRTCCLLFGIRAIRTYYSTYIIAADSPWVPKGTYYSQSNQSVKLTFKEILQFIFPHPPLLTTFSALWLVCGVAVVFTENTFHVFSVFLFLKNINSVLHPLSTWNKVFWISQNLDKCSILRIILDIAE